MKATEPRETTRDTVPNTTNAMFRVDVTFKVIEKRYGLSDDRNARRDDGVRTCRFCGQLHDALCSRAAAAATTSQDSPVVHLPDLPVRTLEPGVTGECLRSHGGDIRAANREARERRIHRLYDGFEPVRARLRRPFRCGSSWFDTRVHRATRRCVVVRSHGPYVYFLRSNGTEFRVRRDLAVKVMHFMGEPTP